MSDSDCSNCPEECGYRDWSYDCYVTNSLRLKTVTTPEMVERLKQLKEDIQSLAEEHDEFGSIMFGINQVLEVFED